MLKSDSGKFDLPVGVEQNQPNDDLQHQRSYY